ncbi:MAG: hypothetical protein RL769_751, partial [Pseudomonadota bacterium]
MTKFFERILQLRWYVILLFGFIALFGFFCLHQIKIDAIPDITNKQVIINTKTFAMDPAKIEKAVTYPIETELYGIQGLIEMRSISKFGLSQIILIFDDAVDIHFARNQVLQRISSIRAQIPNNMTPEIAPLTTGIGEILMYRIFDPENKMDLMELRTIQQFQFSREIKKIKGVAEVDSIGGFERELHLNILPQNLVKYGMTPERLIQQIETVGENFGGGYIEKDGKQKIVRTFANINQFEDVMDIPIKIDYSGNFLTLRHIVEVSPNHSQRLGSATYGGGEAVIGTVMMQSGENAKEVLLKVKNKIAEINNKSSKAKIEILYDRQFLIDSTIKTVLKNLGEGILLVIAVLCLILGNLKIGMIVASSLLFCILILAIFMRIFNVSANLMSLGAIDFGLLVDSSIVIIEYLITHLVIAKSNEQKINSIAKLSAQVAKPIAIGISIIILVYIPILMFDGIEGKTFAPMAINVIIAMLASLAVAFFLMPVLAYFFINKAITHEDHFIFDVIKKRYKKLLNICLKRDKIIIALCINFFLIAVILFSKMPSDFLPELNEGDFVYTVVTSDGNSISKTEEIIQELEKQIINEKEIDKIYSRIGISQSGIDLMPQNSGDIFVILKKDYKENAKNIAKNFITKLQSKCLECEITETQPIKMRFNEMLEGSRADLSLKIFGEDLMQLITITDNIKNLLKEKFDVKNNGYLKEIDKDFINSIKLGHYVDVLPNYQQIARHQIAIANVNNDLKDAMAGIKVGNFYATEFPIPIIMHLNEKNRNDIKAIANIPVGLADGGSFALDQVAKIKESDDISSIPRLFGKRYSGLSIYLTNTQYQKFIDEASKEIKANKLLPDGYVIEWGGRFKNLNSAKKQIMLAIPIIALLIFAILYQMFKDLRKILVMFSAIPFALSGSIILLYICQIPITVSVYVGFIALIGISLLNSIILIDTQNQSLDIETACLTRLRPIVMTAVVASLGFLPMAFGNGIGAEVQQPIAIAVIGGIVSSTISTLILSPILLK